MAASPDQIGVEIDALVYNAGAGSDDDNGGGCASSVDRSTALTSTGAALSDSAAWDGTQTGCTIANNGSGVVRVTRTNAFTNCFSNLIANIEFPTATTANGRYIITKIDDSNIDVADSGFLAWSDVSADGTCDIKIGGALSSIATVLNADFIDTTVQSTEIDRNVYIRGDQSLSSFDTQYITGSNQAGIYIYGVIDDANWTKVSWWDAESDFDAFPAVNTTARGDWQAPFMTFYGMDFQISSTSDYARHRAANLTSINCRYKNVNILGEALTAESGTLSHCWIETTGISATFTVALTRTILLGSTVKSNSVGVSINNDYSYSELINCLIIDAGSGDDGILITGCDNPGNLSIISNTVDGFTYSLRYNDDYSGNGNGYYHCISNNLFANYSSYGIYTDVAGWDNGPVILGNGFYKSGDTVGTYATNLDTVFEENIILSADPFVDQSSGDYRISTSSAAYQACAWNVFSDDFNAGLPIGAGTQYPTGGAGGGVSASRIFGGI